MTDQEYSKTFKATFGVESKAGDIVLEMLTGKEKTDFCNMIQVYYHHLSRCYSELLCTLLLKQYRDLIDNSKWKNFKNNSYKKSALKTMYRKRVEYIEHHEGKMVPHYYWS